MASPGEIAVNCRVSAGMQTGPKSIFILRLLPFLFLLGWLAPALRADSFDTMRLQWVAMQTGGVNNMSDPDVATSVNSAASSANSYWASMNTTAGASYLWSDITNFTVSANIDTMFSRLRTMATAYAQQGNSLHGNAALGQAVAFGLDWLNTHYYNQSTVMFDNWWDWDIGDAQASMTTALLIYDQLTPTEIANYTAAIDRFDPNPSYWLPVTGNPVTATGANLSDVCLAVILRGVLGKNSAKIITAENDLAPVYLYVTSSDGFYIDGSFVQHTYVAYTGGYGSVLLADMANLFLLLNNSAWPITDANAANVYNWASQSFAPLLYRGAMMDMVGGRGISRCGSWDHGTGRSIVTSLLRLSLGASASEAAYLQSLVKQQVTDDTSWAGYVYACNAPGSAASYSSYYSSLSAYDVANIKALMANSAVSAATALTGNFNFAGMQRVVHQRGSYAFALSLYSNKISAFECGNGENLKGWYTGLGMTYLYNADLQQYDNSYWATVNPTRLSGITTDNSTKTPNCSWEAYFDTSSWVGGSAVNGLYGSTGMQFTLSPVTGSSLNGIKSWFWLGNKMAALGAGINSSSSGAAETIVDNRMIDTNGDNALVINGTTEPTTLGWSASLSNVNWAFMDGNATSSGVGYYFPFGTGLNALRETRSGTWNSINTGGNATTHTRNYMSLAISHGVTPADGGYAYVVLPNQTAASMAAYAASPDIAILENSASAQAVYDASINAVGANFWGTSSHTVYDQYGVALLTAASRVSVTAVQTGSELDVAVADPTQANTGSLTLTIGRSASALISADPKITVISLSPTIQLSVNVSGAAGKSFQAKFTVVPKITPTVQVTPGSASITNAQSLPVTVAVSGSSGTPTGTVKLISGSYASAATTLVSGSATITVPAGALAVGTDTLTATYTPDTSGSATYSGASGTNTVTVTAVVVPTFTITGTAVTLTHGANTGNLSTITITPSGGFTGSVALTAAVTSAPSGAQYLPVLTFVPTTPVSITSAAAGTTTLAIATTPTIVGALAYPNRPASGWLPECGAALACLLLFCVPAGRRGWRAMLGMVALLAVLACGVSACSSSLQAIGGSTTNPGTTAGSYIITVTGTSGSTTVTGKVNLTVL